MWQTEIDGRRKVEKGSDRRKKIEIHSIVAGHKGI